MSFRPAARRWVSSPMPILNILLTSVADKAGLFPERGSAEDLADTLPEGRFRSLRFESKNSKYGISSRVVSFRFCLLPGEKCSCTPVERQRSASSVKLPTALLYAFKRISLRKLCGVCAARSLLLSSVSPVSPKRTVSATGTEAMPQPYCSAARRLALMVSLSTRQRAQS